MQHIKKHKKIQHPNKPYLDINRIFKFFPKAKMIIGYGAGGIGKTSSPRTFFDKMYRQQIAEIENGTRKSIDSKFVWLCRYVNEIDQKKKDIFEDFDGWKAIKDNFIIEKEYIDSKESKNGEDIVYKDRKEKYQIGKFVALNQSSVIRGGNSFNEYDYIIWDEFMSETNDYLKDEQTNFKSITTTILRSKKEPKVFCFSNFAKSDHWIFKQYGINPHSLKENEQIWIPEKQVLFIKFEASKAFKEEYKDSALMKIWGEDDAYIKGRVGGEAYEDNEKFIARNIKNEILKLEYNYWFLGKKYTMYRYKNSLYFEEWKKPNTAMWYALTKVDASQQGIPYDHKNNFSNWFNIMQNQDRILYEDTMVKEAIQTFISRGR